MSVSVNDAIFVAAKRGYAEDLRDTLDSPDADEIDFNMLDEYACAPLHYAAGFGHPEVVELLLEVPTVDINIQNFKGETPLFKVSER